MDDDLSERLAEMEERLRAIESGDLLRARGRRVMDRMVPPEARRHFRNGGRESLLGMRTIVDNWIRVLDEREAADLPPSGPERISID